MKNVTGFRIFGNCICANEERDRDTLDAHIRRDFSWHDIFEEHSAIWPMCPFYSVCMPPHVVMWICTSCFQSATVAAADASSQVESGMLPKCPDCQELMTPQVIQWSCPDCKVYTTRTDGNATVCAQCLDWIQRPMMKNWCPECGAPAHTECMNEHCIQTHGKPFDQVKRNVVASDELSRGCPANCPGTRTFRVPPQGLLHYPGSTSSWKNLVKRRKQG